MKLEFSKLPLAEVISSIDETKATDWQMDILNFLKNYSQDHSEIEINEMQVENIFTVNLLKDNIQKAVLALNKHIGIKPGDTTVISQSIRTKDGVISLAQAIEGKMDAFCLEPSEEIKIPYTEQDQSAINWGLNYIYLSEKQISSSSEVLHRIEKIVIQTNGMTDETKAQLYSNKNQKIYEVFSVRSFPIAIRALNDNQFHTFGEVQVRSSSTGHLLVSSPNFLEEIDTLKPVYILDQNTFRWLSKNEFLDTESNHIIDFNHIEEVLRPHIPTQFVVINYPDADTGKEVVTLVVKRLYIKDFNFPTDGLKDYEIPRQNYSLGEFPENNDREVIRREVKRLLEEK